MFPTNVKSGLKSALLLGVSSAAVGLSMPAYADTVETVVVTGSRIPNRDFSSDSPISTVSAESLKATGVVEVTQLMNTLPQVVPSISSGSNNPPSGGQQQIDLRGLGANRVVVLVNGRRAAPSNINGTVDIQTIPQSLISRIEIVSGGESAVYGPDAITGVVNFILKDDFEGAQVDGQYGISERGDNITQSASATIGGNFADGKGNAVITFDWAHRVPVTDAERDFANQATTQTSYFPDGVYRPSATNRPSQDFVNAYFAAHGGAKAGDVPNSNFFVVNPDGSLFNSGGAAAHGVFNFKSDPTFPAKLFCHDFTNPDDCQTYSYNFQPPNLLIVPLNRYNFMGTAHYEVAPDIQAYGEVKFTEYHSASSLAPSPAPTSGVTSPLGEACGAAYCVDINNPWIPGAPGGLGGGGDLWDLLQSRTGDSGLAGAGAGEDFLIRTRFLQLGPRVADEGEEVFQGTAGLKGELPFGHLHFDVFASYGRRDNLELQFGNVSNSAVERALYGLATTPECLAIDPSGYCGYDPFGARQASPESMAYVARIAKNSTSTTFTNIEATFGGDLWDMPAGSTSFSLGADYREQTYRFIPDPLLSSGDISGFNGGDAIAGAVYDREVFGEFYMPIVKDAEWAESISVTVGGRYTEQANTTDGNPFTWKVEGDWSIVDGFTLRASYNVATRVPNIGELFSTSFQNNPTLADPCDFNGPFRSTLTGGAAAHAQEIADLCSQQSGFNPGDNSGAGDPGFVQGTGQISAKSGGNPNLKPETADSWSAGVAWQSRETNPWISNFKASIDYWNIDLHGPIGIDFFDILYGCFNIDGSNPTYSNNNPNCQRIIRSSGGSIYYLNAFETNLAKNQLSGVDLAVAWGLDLPDTVGADPAWGNLGFNLGLTYLNEFNVQGTRGAGVFNYAGTIGATSPIGLTTDAGLPEWKGSLTTTWNFLEDFNLTNRITYVSAMKNTMSLIGWQKFPFGTGPVTGVPATWYFDLYGSWAVTDNLAVRGGVTNLLDQQPRLYNASQQDGTDPALYDIVGRSYFVGVTIKY